MALTRPLSDPSTRLPRWLSCVVVGVCLAPFVLHWSGVDFGTWQRPIRGPATFQLPPELLHHVLLRSVAGSFTQTILQWTAVCIAAVAGMLAVVHYRLRGDRFTAALGAGLVGVAAFDAIHTLAADRLIIPLMDRADFIPLTWALPRVLTALLLILSASVIVIRKSDEWDGSRLVLGLVSVVFGGFAIVLSIFSYNMAQLGYPGAWIVRPYDVPPLVMLLFAAGFVVPTLLRGVPNAFCYALLLSAVPHVCAQTAMLLSSSQAHDSLHNIAQFLCAMGYATPLVGLIVDYVRNDRLLRDEIADRHRIEQALKENESALRKSEKQYRDLFENANDLVQCVGPDGSFLYVNSAWRRSLGYSEDEVRDLNLLEIVYPDSIISSDSQPHKLDFYQRVTRGESLDDYEVHLLARDGRRVIVEGSINGEWIEGRPVASRGIFRDITDRKRLEQGARPACSPSRSTCSVSPGPTAISNASTRPSSAPSDFPTSGVPGASRSSISFTRKTVDATKVFFRKLSVGRRHARV